ncbi:hypothetical protein AVEN_119127-1 [Araneus ventricosus]|uniref:Uncharacterized protein n=1 Tax=Araneus ventricosus TaxID=182803 RepID=A0A4Y2BKF9_ARAVE|nr:hypothetical protein AVEN_119127-1 [Araneus ventricosus]
MGKELTHLEPSIIACQSRMQGELFGNAFEYALISIFDLAGFARYDELHPNTSQRELRIPLYYPKKDKIWFAMNSSQVCTRFTINKIPVGKPEGKDRFL